MASKRVIPVISFEAVESKKLPSTTQERMCRRPNFNRAPRGWGIDPCPESNELWKRADQLKTEALTYAFSSPPTKMMPLLISGHFRGEKKKHDAWYIKWFATAVWFDQRRQLRMLESVYHYSRVQDNATTGWAALLILFLSPLSDLSVPDSPLFPLPVSIWYLYILIPPVVPDYCRRAVEGDNSALPQ